MKIYLKNMISRRCKIMVEEELNKLGINYHSIDLGVIDIFEDLSDDQRNQFKINLSKLGLELLDNKRTVLAESIKNMIIEMIYQSTKVPSVNYSMLISGKLGYDYNYLATVFSEVKGITIQQYIINVKIEKVKELILSNELSIKQIASQVHYSSAAHLSNQFKKITGLTPSNYKSLITKNRLNQKPLNFRDHYQSMTL